VPSVGVASPVARTAGRPHEASSAVSASASADWAAVAARHSCAEAGWSPVARLIRAPIPWSRRTCSGAMAKS